MDAGAPSDIRIRTERSERHLTRRRLLRYGVLSAAASVMAACGPSAASAPTSAPAPAPTTAPAAKPTTAATVAATRAAATGARPAGALAATTVSGAPVKPAGAATYSGPPQTSPNLPHAKINGRLTVLQARDLYDDHNRFVENQIKQFAQQMGYPLDHSYIRADDVLQKVTAAVQVGDPPDVLIHNGLEPAEMHFLDIVDDVTEYELEIQKQQGKLSPAHERRFNIDGKHWGMPHFSRNTGFWARPSVFKAAGIDPLKDLTDYDKLRDAALKVTDPNKPMYGWGMTANRSGDGDNTVRLVMFTWGGQVTDETGQVVVLNKDPYREYNIAAMNWLKDVYTNRRDAPMLPPGVGGWTDPSNNEAWLANKLAFTYNAGTLYALSVHDKNPVADDTVLIPQPKGLGPGARALQNTGDPMAFFIMKGAKNRDAAFQLVQYLMTADAFKQIFTISTGYVYPAREWGWDLPELTEAKYAKNITPAWKQILNDPGGFIGTAWPGPQTPQAGALDNSNFWTDMFGEILVGTAVEDALKSWHDRAVQTFKEFGAKGE